MTTQRRDSEGGHARQCREHVNREPVTPAPGGGAEVELAPAQFVTMCPEEYEAAVRALADLLRPIIRSLAEGRSVSIAEGDPGLT